MLIMKGLFDIMFKAIFAGFGWTIGKNLANRKLSGCMTIVMLFALFVILKTILFFL